MIFRLFFLYEQTPAAKHPTPCRIRQPILLAVFFFF